MAQAIADVLHRVPVWLWWVILGFVSLVIFRRLFVVSIGPIVLLLSPFMMIPYSLLMNYGYPWPVKGLLVLLDLLLGLLWQGIRKIENQGIQARRDHRAQALLDTIVQSTHQENFPIYSLYLRPFASTNRLATTAEGMDVTPPGEYAEHLDLETVLQVALHPTEQLIGLGHPGETIGAGRITSTDAQWQATIARLVEHARSILLLPSDHAGTLWEIQLLQGKNCKNWLSKTIWIMPETIDSGQPVFGKIGYDHAAEWNRVIEAVKPIGIELPPYQEGGKLFLIGPDGRVSREAPLPDALFQVRKLRKGLRSLRDAHTPAQPHKSS